MFDLKKYQKQYYKNHKKEISGYKKQYWLDRQEEKYSKIGYVIIKLPISEFSFKWIEKFKKKFNLLDKNSEYNTVILLKAKGCKLAKASIIVQNLEKIVIIE